MITNPATTIIDGDGATSLSADRVFDIFPTAVGTSDNVSISGLTIQNGKMNEGNGGGGISVRLGAQLSLTNSVVQNNSTSGSSHAFIVGIGTGGLYDLFSQQGSDFVIDVSGYFAAPAS